MNPATPRFAHSCVVSARTPNGPHRYSYFRRELSFQPSAQSANGAVTSRSYRWVAPDGEILSVAHCGIPATPQAAEILDRRLGLHSRRRGVKSGGGESLECGTTANPCTLDSVAYTGGTYWGDEEDWWEDDTECDPWASLCDRSGGDYGGGGGEPDDPYTDGCDPSVDPACEKPLTSVDKDNIANAIDTYIRSIEEIVDKDDARSQCKAMLDKFNSMLAADPPLVFRGATVTQPGDPGVPPHTGGYDKNTGHMHFEQDLLDAAASGDPKALREIANTALHEAAHALGFEHTDSVASPWGPLYTEDYFNKLDAGDDSCMK